ncbi:MAG: nucleoside triphosphate pyrophosphohydrolase [Candidatus Dadabacteria bacterium]|nr:MAG: nucleoside triphosphate pyrophosphohydrolase [Candidatus Dadabacteria bacterium]
MGHSSDRHSFSDLIALMHRLRAPGGCPWDREQTHESLKPYLIEEAYEVIEAIDGGDDRALCEELGDLLLQVVFHAELAAERGAFTMADVVDRLCQKLIERHPHVFADVAVSGSAEVVRNWHRIKNRQREQERGNLTQSRPSALDGVPRAMPALLRAHRLGQKAAAVGFDWKSAAAVTEKIREELAEIAGAEDRQQRNQELGDLLFAVASYVRLSGSNAETALQEGLDRFERRFRRLEELVRQNGMELQDLAPERLEALWEQVKSEEEDR